ncbi:hypothetical protein K9N68_39635 (plasmid) [Kovacikia minuta CCNUW1]|uniref:hypothetical protein n=1 Tax=Kovacikia minuta TaxID=2931930 RepID=UPI001CCFB392|nr:hypothetical protein [Kovacikia minuta]UBF30768.1 hypothetical protein K9N68_39635 [Kovacikia minuta CCNUW1]
MPLNLDNAALNEHQVSKPKRPKPNPDLQQQQMDDLGDETQKAIGTLAQTGFNTINAQVFAFDGRLTKFERDTARAMANRLRQSPTRIQHYLAEELLTHNVETPDFEVFAEEFEVPDLTSKFLAAADRLALPEATGFAR